MVGSNGTILTIRLLRSKIRKREDSSATPVHVESHQAVLPNETTPPVAYRQNSSVWVFPPLPPQPNLYNANSQVRIQLFSFFILLKSLPIASFLRYFVQCKGQSKSKIENKMSSLACNSSVHRSIPHSLEILTNNKNKLSIE